MSVLFLQNIKRKEVILIKEITQREIQVLKRFGKVQESNRSLVSPTGEETGYFRTKHKAFIENKYVDIARNLIKNGK